LHQHMLNAYICAVHVEPEPEPDLEYGLNFNHNWQKTP
jgi:hypothetical protein